MAATAQQEVESLDRVLTRLATTEEANLEKVLSRLLPVVLGQLKSPHEVTKKKVLEMLSHVNKRVRGHDQIKLPLDALLDLYLSETSVPLVKNFAVVYVEMAMDRSTQEQQAAAVSKLLRNISSQSSQHQHILLRLAMVGLESLAQPPPKHQQETEENFAAKYAFLQSAPDRTMFLEFATKVMLYQPAALLPRVMPTAPQNPAEAIGQLIQSSIGGGPLARGSSGGSLTRGSSHNMAGPLPTPPGLAKQDIPLIEGKAAPSVMVLQKRKIGLLNFTAAAGVELDAVLLLYLIAAADPQDPVSRRGEELLRKRCGLDSPKPSVNLEDPALVANLFHLFQGSSQPTRGSDVQAAAASVPDDHVMPAGVLLQSRLINLFTKSTAAANFFPGSVEVILSCVYGSTTTARLKQQGMEFAVWLFKHADDAQLQPHSNVILQNLLRLLNEESAASDTPTLTLRGFTYQAVGQLANRIPQLFQNNTDIAAQFFSALSVEPPGVRAALQEAVSTLALAYKGCSGEAAARIEQLLLGSITSPQEASRLCAVQWANRLFPFEHVPARYICALAAGDIKLEIREEGQSGLKPPKPQPGAAEIKVTYPQLAAVVSYTQDRHSALKQAAATGRGSLDMTKPLPLQPKAYLALISFLRECRKQNRNASESPSQSYLGLLEHALVKDSTGELHSAAIQALLEVAADSPDHCADLYRGQLSWLKSLLSHTDATARDTAGKLCGIVVLAVSPATVEAFLTELVAGFADGDIKKHKFEVQDGYLAATGSASSLPRGTAAGSQCPMPWTAAHTACPGRNSSSRFGSCWPERGPAPAPARDTQTCCCHTRHRITN